jgi:ATP-binding cassette, subfamily C (CFTR/MRP), member 1
MALSIPVIVYILYWIQKFYLRTSRQMRFLDLEAKSPMYQHFTETLEGLATIRAFGWQDKFEEEAVRRLEESQKPFYLMFCIQLWLNVVLSMLGAGLAVVLMGLAMCIPSSSGPGSLGVALNSTLTLNGSLQSLISFWTDTETSLGSIARTRTYEDSTPNENQTKTGDPGQEWPQGDLKLSEIIVIYKDETAALKNVDIHIDRGRKFGICGRTGR